ncbi:DNA-dependent protein kinase subunit [Cavenderia fasciculata]|uniref:DNA-dependent protein kinase subunit n=1 Tax=Cavenderia fasciculata TaxID=261658 RepID=F4QCS0_CACFS|nr:DNA-dependent protein kinase subunit [Cavenderia fasciculata]EGG13652.1 DNA-dependent protein kinase subunit [Cavenderia fasciculata]|eukprot:XP_004350356.1 DNA-dependent protein kinase subunit [Cavenderia fasciculata]
MTGTSTYQKIEDYLIKLHASLNAQQQQQGSAATSYSAMDNDEMLIDELSNIIMKELVDEEIGLAASLLFQGDHNILKYLTKTGNYSVNNSTSANTKIVVKIKCQLLQLTTDFIKNYRAACTGYIVSIKNLCISLFRKDQSQTVQALSFKPIQKILTKSFNYQTKQSSIKAELFGVRDMTDKLIEQFTCGKLSQTVKGEILITLGLFSEHFPSVIMDYNNQLATILMETLGSQLKSKAPETVLILSSIKALDCLLVHFSGDFMITNNKHVQQLYHYLFICTDPQSAGQRFEIPRSAMQLINHHAPLFKQYLTEQSEKMFTRLEFWCNHNNKLNRDIAFNCIDTFLAQIAKEMTSGQRSIESDQTTFKFFIRKFYSIFENTNSSTYEISIAIRGCSRFALPVKQFIGEWELKSLLGSLFKFSEKLMIVKLENIEEIVMHLSSFINAFSNILFEINDIEFWYLDPLEQIVGTFFIIYPYLFEKQRDRYYSAINRLFASLYFKGDFLKTLLTRIVRQGMIITFSKPNLSLINYLNTGDTPWYEVYKDVWFHLLHPKKEDTEYNKNRDTPPVNAGTITSMIYNEMISSLISLIQKLDLSYSSKDVDDIHHNPAMITTTTTAGAATDQKKKQDDEDEDATDEDEESNDQEEQDASQLVNDDNQTLIPSTAKDIELFLNLVEFVKIFVPYNHPKLLVPWIYIFGKEVIFTSKKYPLISGFYKLMQVIMKVCKKENYFAFIDQQQKKSLTASIDSAASNSGETFSLSYSMDIDDDENNTTTNQSSNAPQIQLEIEEEEIENKKNCFILFNKFIQEVLSCGNQFKDELLASCIQLLLSIPKQLIDVGLLIPTLKTSFKLGLSYLKLGHSALNAIEYWIKVVPLQFE